MKFRKCLPRKFQRKIWGQSHTQVTESADHLASGPSDSVPDVSGTGTLPNTIDCSPYPVPAAVEPQGLISLWQESREKLCQDPELGKLVDRYEKDLFKLHESVIETRTERGSNVGNPAVGDVDATLTFQRIILEDQVEAWENSRHTGINKVIGKVVQVIMTGKDFITTAISGDPHASLAWAEVLIFLPILLNPVTQDEDALTGFEEICHVLIRSEIVERRLWKEPQKNFTSKFRASKIAQLHPNPHLQDLIRSWRLTTIELYAAILEYQIQLYAHLSRNGSTRFFRNVVPADPWNDILQTIQELQTTIDEDLKSFGFDVLSDIDKTINSVEDKSNVVIHSPPRLIKSMLI
ncbi:hypothetical protein OCU04_009155 [Sclerotinia nivalis]|uniref:NWD NACHT-NTPase N-terminal domain-containing protein n=1 Tax=Sclerotinia nivalis TaxID=352851 RepID=A0A9X0AH22_9HELO|nr:hypothetical protein OCU04_009155 [Sclerotinia nivalis]